MLLRLLGFVLALVFIVGVASSNDFAPLGYYRHPAIHGDTIVFTAEGDLWKVGVQGGVAQRLTSHLKQEDYAAISPDGATIAFCAQYEGSTEIYTMPINGGLPERQTYEAGRMRVVGWTPAGEILYSTRKYSTLPDNQLVAVDPRNYTRRIIPLHQADQGAFDDTGTTLIHEFTRLPFQGSRTKRYRGGTAQNLWKFVMGGGEAVPLTVDFPGTTKDPMWWGGRVYYVSDQGETMNLWSMNPDGRDRRQLTRHKGWDVQSPSLSDGRIAYQLGADLHLYEIEAGTDAKIPIRVASDFDQTREKWVEKPPEYITSVHPSPNGDRVVVTARGGLFTFPVKDGRVVEVTRGDHVRYRDGRFLPDGKTLLAMSDESGEVEFWKVPADGIGEAEQITNDGKVLRRGGVAAPDGKWIAHHDKDQEMWLLEVETKTQRKIAFSPNGEFRDLSWSPDSRWLAFGQRADNTFLQIKLYNVETRQITDLTTDRYNSRSPAWSSDGEWLYFLSDRHLESLVRTPWGTRQPEPFFDRTQKIYHLPLKKGLRSPFQPDDELHPDSKEDEKEDKSEGAKEDQEAAEDDAGQTDAEKEGDEGDTKEEPVEVEIDLDGIERRLIPVPASPGNYRSLSVSKKRLYWISTEAPKDSKPELKVLEIQNEEKEPETWWSDVRGYELTFDRKKVMVRKGKDIFVFPADKKPPAKKKEIDKAKVDLKDWKFSVQPLEEFRHMFIEAWRLERDYFYDRGMHGVDWPAVRDKYLPLVERVTDRAELSDLIGQMVGELSALHIFVVGGDHREGQDDVTPASLGALLSRNESLGGYLVDHIYQPDPDHPEKLSPLARQDVDIREGDIILAINGVKTLSEPSIGALLRNQTDRQVRLRVRPADASQQERDVIVEPISGSKEADLRYEEWEYTRRLKVDEWSSGEMGYVHLRAMGSRNIAEWARQYYPVFNRKGLVLDVRHNRGGNIDSWILEKLLRKAWFFWQPRVGNPTWNMQYAFRGHMVILCDQMTASDGEAVTEGFRRLGLGKVIGTRTWGGEIWLSFSNFLVDRGIASAAEVGVFGPEGEWLIEGHGVDPDIVVDNLPHATFKGEDAQLRAAVEHLQQLLREQPISEPKAPPYPDKSLPAE